MAGTLLKARWIAGAALVAATFALLTLGGAAPAGARGTPDGCPNARAQPADVTVAQLRQAITCLIHQARERRDRKKVRGEPHLKRVAQDHNDVMLEQDCFEHECRGEAPLEDRIVESGYLEPGDRFGYAENTGYAKTPAAMLREWLHSSFHRRNLVGKRFRHLGVGAGKGTPDADQDDAEFATYTVILAWRKS